jgi:hypothetical protein
LADHNGRTVAHVAAVYGHLPKDFDQWGLADNNGWTVAHEAAKWAHLPVNFSQWDLVDGNDVRVSDLAKEQYRQWRIKSEFEQSFEQSSGWSFEQSSGHSSEQNVSFL